jgi:PBS lyase HEAT-like repeat
MTTRRAPPASLVLRLSESVDHDPERDSLQWLRSVVRGDADGFPRGRAIALLLESDWPYAHRDLQAVLEDDGERFDVRHFAATGLARINTPAAYEILLANAAVRDERVRAAVCGLGRIGDDSARTVLERASRGSTGVVLREACFAAALVRSRCCCSRRPWSRPARRPQRSLRSSQRRQWLPTRWFCASS